MSGGLLSLFDPNATPDQQKSGVPYMGLLGMAQAIAAANAPSPYKQNLGYLIGMGAGGLGQGLSAAQGAMSNNNSIQAGQMANQFTKATMPYKLGLLNAAMPGSIQGQAPVNGQTYQAGPQGGGAYPTPPQGQSGNPYLVDPRTQAQQATYALVSGQDRAASALYGNLQQEAGGQGYAMGANGNAFYVPGGSADPNQVALVNNAKSIGTNAGNNATQPINIGTAANPIWTTANQAQIINGSQGAPQGFAQGNGQPSSPDGQSGGFGNALSSIPAPLQLTALQAAAQAGLPPAAIPAWISSIHNESGWNPQAPQGKAGEIGIAQVKPATAQAMGLDPSILNTPGGNLYASAKYFAQGWQQGNSDPAKALAYYNSGTTTNPDTAYVQPALARLNGWGAQGSYGSQSTVAPGVTINHLPSGGVSVNDTSGLQKDLMDKDNTDLNEMQDEINQRTAAAATLQAATAKAQGYPTGAWANTKLDISNFVTSTFGPQFAQNMNLPDTATGQQIIKSFTLSAAGAEKDAQGSRASLGALNIFMKNLPSIVSQPQAIKDINYIYQLKLAYDNQYAAGATQFQTNSQQAFTSGQSNYVPQTEYDNQWNKQTGNGQLLAAGLMAATGVPYKTWAAGLNHDPSKPGVTPDQVIQFVWTHTPDAAIRDPQGNLRPGPASQ